MKNLNLKRRRYLLVIVACLTFYTILTQKTMVMGSGQVSATMNKVTVDQRVELITDDINNSLDAIDLAVTKFEESIKTVNTPEGTVIIEPKATEHVEDCLAEDCGILTCMTNVSTELDYEFGNHAVLFYTENGSPVYGFQDVINWGVDRDTFLRTVAPFAQAAQKEFGIPASTILAQSILETGWGKKVIGNNIFGIKATSSYTGPVVKTGTKEYTGASAYSTTDIFRGYNSVGEAVYDYAKNVISGNPELYGGVVTDNWIDSIYGLGPYATDPQYFELVISVIQDFDLTRFNNLDYTVY